MSTHCKLRMCEHSAYRMSTHCKLRMCEHSGYRMFTHCKHRMFAQHHVEKVVFIKWMNERGIAVFCAICDWQQTDWLTKRVAFVTEKPFFFHFFFHIFTHVEHFNFVFLYQIFMISSILRGLLYTFHPSSAHVESQSNNSKAFLKWGICPRYGSVWQGVAKCARGFW